MTESYWNLCMKNKIAPQTAKSVGAIKETVMFTFALILAEREGNVNENARN